MNQTEWKKKWDEWVKLTLNCLKRNMRNWLDDEEEYWKIIRNFGDFFDRNLGYDGPNPKSLFKELYGELYARFIFLAPAKSWLHDRGPDTKRFLDIMQRRIK